MNKKLPLLFSIITIATLTQTSFVLALDKTAEGEFFYVNDRFGSQNPSVTVEGKDIKPYNGLEKQTESLGRVLPNFLTPEEQKQYMEEGLLLSPTDPSSPKPDTSVFDPNIAFPKIKGYGKLEINMEKCPSKNTPSTPIYNTNDTKDTITSELPDWASAYARATEKLTEIFSIPTEGVLQEVPTNTHQGCGQEDKTIESTYSSAKDGAGTIELNSFFNSPPLSWVQDFFRDLDKFGKIILDAFGNPMSVFDRKEIKTVVQPITTLKSQFDRILKPDLVPSVTSIPEFTYVNNGSLRWSFVPDSMAEFSEDTNSLFNQDQEKLNGKSEGNYAANANLENKDHIPSGKEIKDASIPVPTLFGAELAKNWLDCSLSLPEENCSVSPETGYTGSGTTYVTITATSLREMFRQAANHVGVPVAVLKAIAKVEAGRIFGYSEDEVKNFSTYGWWNGLVSKASTLGGNDPLILRGLGYNTCKYRTDCFPEADVRGAMQFEIQTWNGIASQIDFGHTADRRVLPDAIVAAAKLIKNHAITLGESSTSNWSEAIIKGVAARYCGNPKSSACGGNYDNVVWDLYQEYLKETD
ncbi:MAG: hypothetical protein M1150_03800 [Patescibacteria group bacterium]|nr:hypothetical protein [Patescibacteria group bacterium]